MISYNGYTNATLQRAQVRGQEKQRRGPTPETWTRRILAAAKLGPATSSGFAVRLGLDPCGRRYRLVVATLSYLARTARLRDIGCVLDARCAGIEVASGTAQRKFVRSDARVFALPGTPDLPTAPVEMYEKTHVKSRARYPVKTKKSEAELARLPARGEFAVAARITIPQYRWHGAQFRRAEG